MTENRNLILAIVLSIFILLSFELYSNWRQADQPPLDPQTQGQLQGQPAGAPSSLPGVPATAVPTPTVDAQVPSIPGSQPASTAQVAEQSRQALINATPRITIEAPRVHGTISLVGGRIDDLTLSDYHEELDKSSPPIVLLSPSGAPGAYFADFGWVGTGIKLPEASTLWAADRSVLSPGKPVTLSWNNDQGQIFRRTFAIDENYMFSITQSLENRGSGAVTLYPYSLISRHDTPEVTGFYILHEGLLGVFDETLQEVDYSDLQEKPVIQNSSTGGWLGITDKYWLTALIPDQKATINTRFSYQNTDGKEKYQVDFLGAPVTIAPGASTSAQSHLFAGAKEVKLLDGYEEQFGVKRFDLAIDFGWFYFLTKPIFYTMIYINDQVGNFGVAILLLTVLVKLLFFPLANKSYVAMSKMKKLQPEMVKLRERFGDDKTRMNQELMALYKREKANPASGCLPIVVQIPVFFALYKVLFVTIEMRHAPFFGWIHDLSAPDPSHVLELFGLIPWGATDILPEVLLIGAWPLIMGITMFLQQRLNPQPADPMQAKIFMFLPILFTFMLARFPAGLVIYWAWNNSLSIIQQKIIMNKMGVK